MHGNSHRQAHRAYPHKSGHKKKDKITKTPNIEPVPFESAPLGAHLLPGVSKTSTVLTSGSTGTTAGIARVVYVGGGFVLGGLEPDRGPGQEPKVLWRKGWSRGKLVCAVPKLFQPSKSTKKPSLSSCEFPRDTHGSNLSLHCIDLQLHNRELKLLLSDARSRVFKTSSVPDPPARFCNPASLAPRRVVTDAPHPRVVPVELDQSSLHQLLKKATAATCAYAGYDDASSQALDVLSTVLGDYLSNLTRLMRTNSDRALESGGCAFADIIDQSLHQTGLAGGKAGLELYWKDRVKGFVHYLQEEISEAAHEYMRLANLASEVPVSKKKGEMSESPDLCPSDLKPLRIVQEEFSLESALEHTNMDNVLPLRTPDVEDPVGGFSEFLDEVSLEGSTNDFSSLGLDPPPTKRFRSISFGD